MNKFDIKAFLASFSLRDIRMIRSVLDGEAVIDWRALHFKTHQEVIQFLKVNEFDIQNGRDLKRLAFIYQNALSYLQEVHEIEIPEIFQHKNIIDLFLMASNPKTNQYAALTCSILKVMNIINHIDSQDLVSHIPIKRSLLADQVKKKLLKSIDQMKALGYPDVEFQWSIKERNSIISKFLTKQEGIIAHISDRIRIRIVTDTKEQLLPVLYYLFNFLFPYNYVISNQTRNNLLTLSDKMASPNLDQLISFAESSSTNRFSGPSYKILNFVVDIPIRLDDMMILPDNNQFSNHAYIIYMLTEVQMLDRETTINNEKGENAHPLYKERQKRSILKRLDPDLYKEKYHE